MSTIDALVEPGILRWARETAGFRPDEVGRALGLEDEAVAAWERGEGHPTITQLKDLAHKYRRSISVFFLTDPPQGFDTLRDFRRIAGAPAAEWSFALHAEYHRAHAQREVELEVFDAMSVEPPASWMLTNLSRNDEQIGERARRHLRELATSVFPERASADVYDHLGYWVHTLETAGVIVHATERGLVTIKEARAFSLYFEQLPVIVVNGSDFPRGRLFSLLHEYAHLLLHSEGLCDLVTDRRATSENRQLEARCNAIAAAILMPAERIIRAAHTATLAGTWTYNELAVVARQFGVSAEAALLRLVQLGSVTWEVYNTRRDGFHDAYEVEEDKRRQKTRGGDANRTAARDLGKGYIRLVYRAWRDGVIQTDRASTYLGVRAARFDKLARAARPPGD